MKSKIVSLLNAKGIKVNGSEIQQKVLCPSCSATRKKRSEPCLSVNIETGLFHCFNCGYSGGVVAGDTKIKEVIRKGDYAVPQYDPADWELNTEAIEYFANRGISKQTLEINKIGATITNFTKDSEKEELVLAFPFIKADNIVNVKYRTADKKMRSVKNAESCFYGMQNLFEDGVLVTKKLIIVEGEIDLLSLYEVGFKYAISVPSGAPVEEEGKTKIIPSLPFLEDPAIQSVLDNIDEVVFVTDADYKGKRLREELATRIGIDRCFSVEYPSDCKDANDVLVKYGVDSLVDIVLDAKPMMRGLTQVSDLNASLLSFYQNGLERGILSGIDAFDDLYTLQTGLITLVTGTPESFKTTLVDNLLVGYAKTNNIHTALFSPETKPLELHVGRLACIDTGLSLDKNSINYMAYDEFKASTEWLNSKFSFIQPKVSSLSEILALAKVSILRNGTKILVIDPYSRIRIDSDIEHNYIKELLNEVGEFAVKYDVHVFIVAHPTKMDTSGRNTRNYPIVTPYHIAGSANWFNSSDFILSLWKDRNDPTQPIKVYCLKSKYHHIAKSDTYCELYYDFDNWSFS